MELDGTRTLTPTHWLYDLSSTDMTSALRGKDRMLGGWWSKIEVRLRFQSAFLGVWFGASAPPAAMACYGAFGGRDRSMLGLVVTCTAVT